MDSKKIKALLTAIECGSLTAAAMELGYTQSGLTHMMNSLETELGVNLLVRSKTGVHFSPAGHALAGDMRRFLESSDALEHSAARLREQSVSTLRLGAYSSIARHWLPSILASFRRECPETEVTMTVGTINGIYELVKNDELDCAIVSRQTAMCQGLSWVPLRDDALVAILPADYRSHSYSFPVEEFEGKDFLMPANGFEMDILPSLNAPGHKASPRIRYTNLDDDIVASMVEHGLGVSVLSELVMQGIRDRVCALPLEPPAYRQLGIIINERLQNDRNIRRFVRCARETIAQMYNERAFTR